MCGIAGFINCNGQAAAPAVLQAMTSVLAHRGPDGHGYYIHGPIALGHRRLSIIDIETGKQPLSNEDGSVWITFNGEIYNYRDLRDRLVGSGHLFRTDSDTETIVHAYEQWGTDCLHYLRGMFAFAIWDTRQQSLFLARDRLGIKPLLYSTSADAIVFGSEIQALMQLPGLNRDIDLQAIDQFLHYQYIPAPRTIYQHIKKLEPAHSIVIKRDGTTRGPQRYWKLRFQPDRRLTADQWRGRLQEALTETVRTHLVSDVPFGAFLSGGIDSSLVVASMSAVLNRPVKAFCIGHSRPDFDERPWARHAAQACNVELIEQVIDEDSLDLIPKLVQHYGEPFADSSALPTYYVSRLAAEHVKMALSGDGGDELFAGYYAYPAILWDHRSPHKVLPRIKYFLANAARRCRIWPAIPSPADSKYRRTSPLAPEKRRSLWRPDYHPILEATRADFDLRFRASRQSHLLNSLQAFDVENYIPFDNLAKVDIASMYHGLEVRVPLLDHIFLDTVCQIPPELKISGLDQRGEILSPPDSVSGKVLLKRLAEQRFGEQFVQRPKRGFEVPIQHWFQGNRGDELRQRILDSSLPLADWFDVNMLKQQVEAAANSKLDAWQGWSLLILAEWAQQHQAAPTSPRMAEPANCEL